MSDIVCLNSAVSEIQQQAFLIDTQSNGSNRLTSCADAYRLNIDAFFGKNEAMTTNCI